MMETRQSVRERRLKKIRQLQEGTRRAAATTEASPAPVRLPLVYDRETRPDGGEEPYGMLDPEAEWNRKWRLDLDTYDRSYRKRSDLDPDQGRRPGGGRFGRQLIVSGLLLALIWGLFQLHEPWAVKGQRLVTAYLNESFDVAAVSAWYEQRFGGAPSFLPALHPSGQQEATKVNAASRHYFAPVQGKVIAAMTPGQSGVLIQAKPGVPVAAMATGWVVFAGKREDTGFTVVLRHTDGMESTYGHLEQGAVKENDWVKGGETVGTLPRSSEATAGTLFFAVAQNGRTLNPTDVVPFE